MSALVYFIKRYPLAIFSGVVVLICLLVNYMRGDAVGALELIETELYGEIRKVEQNKINANELEPHIEELKEHIAHLESRLIDKRQRALNTNFFYSLENDADVIINSVTPSGALYGPFDAKGALELKKYSALTFDLNLKGTYPEMLKFMQKIYSSKPLMRLADFQISGGGQGVSEPLNGVFTVLVLSKKD